MEFLVCYTSYKEWMCHLNLYSDHTVAQLRLIFRPVERKGEIYSGPTLAYVEYFKQAKHALDENMQMFRFIRKIGFDKEREGGIIKLTDIWRPIQLVPVFGKSCPKHWDFNNSVELAQEFFVNSFWEKETYQSVY